LGQKYIYKENFLEMGGACRTYGGRVGAHGDLVRKPERKRPLGRPRHRWEDNITWLRVRTGGGHL